jgi:hypothetical protein
MDKVTCVACTHSHPYHRRFALTTEDTRIPVFAFVDLTAYWQNERLRSACKVKLASSFVWAIVVELLKAKSSE